MNTILLNIENKLFTYIAKSNSISDFNPKKLNIQKEGNDETSIYYIDYDKHPFCLVIDDSKGYFEENNDNKYLTIIFKSKDQKMIYTKVWEEIKKTINKVDDNKLDDYSKDYGVISFDSDDVLPLNFVVNIRSLTIIIRSVFKDDSKFYPQIYLNYC